MDLYDQLGSGNDNRGKIGWKLIVIDFDTGKSEQAAILKQDKLDVIDGQLPDLLPQQREALRNLGWDTSRLTG